MLSLEPRAAINPAGAIAGQYVDTSGVFHGFLRSPDGAITPFDIPGAGTGVGQGSFVTFGAGITPTGAIAGGIADANCTFHSAVRAKDGSFTLYDVPGAGTGPSQGTDEAGINPAVTSTGFYIDASNAFHGFRRTKSGSGIPIKGNYCLYEGRQFWVMAAER